MLAVAPNSNATSNKVIATKLLLQQSVSTTESAEDASPTPLWLCLHEKAQDKTAQFTFNTAIQVTELQVVCHVRDSQDSVPYKFCCVQILQLSHKN